MFLKHSTAFARILTVAGLAFLGTAHISAGVQYVCTDCGCNTWIFSELYHGSDGGPVCAPTLLLPHYCTSSGHYHHCDNYQAPAPQDRSKKPL